MTFTPKELQYCVDYELNDGTNDDLEGGGEADSLVDLTTEPPSDYMRVAKVMPSSVSCILFSLVMT